jgi:hypothetical protein
MNGRSDFDQMAQMNVAYMGAFGLSATKILA